MKKFLLFKAVMVIVIMLFTLYGEAATTTIVKLYAPTATSVGGIATTSEQFTGSGAWQNNPGVSKMELWLPLTALGTFSINDIASLKYSTKKILPAGSNLDFFFSIYTNPYTGGFASWYGQRLTSEPMYYNSYNAPYHTWNTNNTTSGTNQMTFFDSNHSPYGYSNAPTLADLQAGPVNFNYTSPYWISGSGIDYGVQTVKLISIGTGSAWNAGFLGFVDDIEITLNNGDKLIVDLEKDPTPTTTIGNPTFVACDTYDVPVTVQDFTNIGAISLTLNYDPLVFSYLGITKNPAISSTFANGSTPGQFILGGFPVPALTLPPNDVLFVLHLTLLPSISGTTNLTWSTGSDCEYAGPGGTPVYLSNFLNKVWIIPVRPVKNTDTGLEYCTIQAAIDATATVDGNHISVAAGTYQEQVTINKSIHLTGASGAIIQSPLTLPAASDPLSSIVIITGSGKSAEINGFTIQGPGPAGCGSIGRGIFVRDGAYANIHDNQILDIRDNPFSGCQNGIAIQVGRNVWSTSGNAIIANNIITGYQKGGIVVDNTGSSANISGNTITGSGTTNVTAQNGIQISRGATATLSGNSVTGNSYHSTGNSSDWGACGILLYQSGAIALTGGNILTGNDQNYYATGVTGALTIGAELFGNSSAPRGMGNQIVNSTTFNIDAKSCSFGGVSPAAMTMTQLFALEDMIYHQIDNPAKGFVNVNLNNTYVTTNSFDLPTYPNAQIQRGIDASSDGFTVNVQAGAYGIQTAADRSVFGINGPHLFGLFIDKNNLTIKGYKPGDIPVATASEAAVEFQTGSTANFGPDGVFAQANGVTLEGLKIGDNMVNGSISSNKTIDVIGDAFTMKKCFINTSSDEGAFYMGRWDATHPIVTYSITNNIFNNTLVSINNGVGVTGPRSGRVITGNTFTGVATPYLIGFRGWNGTGPVQGWIVDPVGGAVVTGNAFNNTGVVNYVIARGNAGGYVNSELLWNEIWNLNTYGNHVVTLANESTFDVRSFADAAGYSETRRISPQIQENVTIGQSNDVVLVSSGTFNESVLVNTQVKIKGAQTGILAKGRTGLESFVDPNSESSHGFKVVADNVTIEGFTITNSAPYPSGGERYGVVTIDKAGTGNFTGINVKNNIISRQFKAIDFNSTDNFVISGNWLHGENASYNYGCLWIDDYGTSSNHGFIQNNDLDGYSSVVEIQGDLTHPVSDLRISENRSTGGQYVLFGLQNSTVYRNTVLNSLTGSHVFIGGGCKDDLISENFFDNGSYNGVSVSNNYNAGLNSNLVITNNSITGHNNPGMFEIKVSASGYSGILDAHCNWYGINTVSGVAAKTSGPVSYSPWLIDGTTLPGGGFVPAGSCSGEIELFVNDGSTTDDVFTTAIGNDVTGNGSASAPFATITKAVSVAMVGTTIKVDAGTYQEQVQIGKTLNIVGLDKTKTIITAPATLTSVTWNNAHPIVYAFGNSNTVNISNITIDGNDGRSVSWYLGAFYYEANGTFDGNKINGIHDAGSFSGMQSGHGFYGVQGSTMAQSLAVTNNVVDDYQKGGIYVRGAGISATIAGNTITGQNVPEVTAQNGICVMFGASCTISGNTVSNNIWNKVEHPHTYTASGILLFQAGVCSVSGNFLNGNEIALSSSSSVGVIYGVNNFSNNKMHLWLDVAGDVNPGNIYDKYVLNPSMSEAVFGCIQYAVDEASSGNTLNVSAHTFTENVIVHTPVIINGAGKIASTTVIPAFSGPNPCSGSSLCPGASTIFLVQANDVTIQNLTVDGDNPSLTSGILKHGADLDARNGIITNHALGVYNNLNVNNITLKNIYLRGIYASTGGSFNFHDNIIANVDGESNSIAMFNFGGAGAFTNNNVSYANDAISSNWSTGTTYSGNTVSNSGSGIHTDNNDGGGADVIENNTIIDSPANGYGIFVYAPYKNVLVQKNTITNVEVGLTIAGSYSTAVPVFTQNTVDGKMRANSIGVYTTTEIWGYGSGNQNVVFSNNLIRNNVKGFLLASELGYTNTTTANENSITGNTIGVKLVKDYTEVPPTGAYALDMKCNWWGSTAAAAVATAVGASAPPVNYTPWLIDGTDSSPLPGFQPVSGACNGTPLAVILNAATDVTCPGSSDGTINIDVSGGSGSYSYLWTPGNMNTEDLTGLPAGIYTVVVTDTYGSMASLQVIVGTMLDNTPPVLTCPSTITVQCVEPAPYNNFAAFTAAGGSATDYCGIDDSSFAWVSDVKSNETCVHRYTITRTYKIKDVNGNWNNCTQTIVVNDITAPTGTPPVGISGINACYIDAVTPPAGTPAFNPIAAAVGYTDNCTGTVAANLTNTAVTGTNCNWTVTYTFKVADACGNELTGQTIQHTGGNTTPLVVTANGSKTAPCTANAVDPTLLSTVADQQQLQVATDLTTPVWSDFTSIGQSFTCGTSGWFTQLDLQVQTLAALQSFTLEIYLGNGIGGTKLYSGSHSLAASGWQSLNIAQNLAPYLTAGTQYTFWLTSFTYNQLGLLCMHPDVYAGGVSMDGCTESCSPTYAWQQWPDYDLVFKTYMTVVPLITDACGTIIPTPAPVITNVPEPITCEGTRTYTYTYAACSGLPTNWVYTYTIDYSGGLTPPVNSVATVSCETMAFDPGAPANITDACGRSVNAVLVGRTPETGPECIGTVEWKYKYTACDNTTVAYWTKTYTITNTGGLTPPANGSSTVSGPAQAINPGAPANITDACGRTVSAVLIGSSTPPACEGTVVWTYRYTACDGTTTADWTYTYTIVRNTINGTLTYNNISNTPLSNVTVKLMQGNVQFGTAGTTNSNGSYTMSDVCPGTYDVVMTTAKPAGGINATDAAQVNAWFVAPYAIEKVRFYGSDVVTENILNPGDAGRILQYFVQAGNPTWAPRSKWTFWKVNDLISMNPVVPPVGIQIPTITVAGNMSNQNFYGLCTGDFNRSFTPSVVKSASENLTLNYGKTIQVNPGSEFNLPVNAGMDMQVGAVSVILNFPSDLLDVNGVYLANDPDSPLQYSITGNELRIGWNSLEPISLLQGERLLTLKITIKGSTGTEGISFSLAGDPLNELADGNYDVINNATLTVDMITTSALGTGDITLDEKLAFSNHPNPFKGTTTFVYSLPVGGKVTLEINNVLGSRVMNLLDEDQTAGQHTLTVDASALAVGLYTATLKLVASGTVYTHTIKIIRNK